MRVVIDTNVFVSSFFGGNPRAIIDKWIRGELTLCLSGEIVTEYIEVLLRLGLDQEEMNHILSLFSRGFNCLFTAKTPDLKIVEEDPNDDKFIECAVSLNASFIVSGDQDLVGIKSYMGILIVTPKQLLGDHP